MAIFVGPAAIPPKGVNPNFENPESLYPSMLATAIPCCTLTTLFTTLRLITKHSISSFNLEDYVLMAAWAANLGYDIVFLLAGHVGLGRHLWDVRAVDFAQLAQLSWTLELLYGPTIWLGKVALLLQLIRIFSPMKSGPMYWLGHALIWVNLALYTAILFTLIFECSPIEKVWNPLYEGGHCINRNTALIVSGAVNVLSDLLNLLLPLWATWHLQMTWKRKAGISAVFATGLIACASSIFRLFYTARLNFSLDDSYIVAQVAMWTLAELATIILCTCFPMMPRFMKLVSEQRPKAGYVSSYLYGYFRKARSGVGTTGDTSRRGHDANSSLEDAEDMAQLDNRYVRLGDQRSVTDEEAGRTNPMMIKRTVDIELVTRDQTASERRAASMV